MDDFLTLHSKSDQEIWKVWKEGIQAMRKDFLPEFAEVSDVQILQFMFAAYRERIKTILERKNESND